MLFLECEVGGMIRTPLRAELEYSRKYDPGRFVALVDADPAAAAELGHVVPPEARTLEEIFLATGVARMRVLNVISLNSYLLTGTSRKVENRMLWDAVYIETAWGTGNGQKTYAAGGQRMFALLSSPEELERERLECRF